MLRNWKATIRFDGWGDFLAACTQSEVRVISNIGRREVKVPHGTYNAVGIQHRKEGSDRITTLWCAEELDYLPVLIEQHRDGKRALRAELRKYAELPASVASEPTETESTAAVSEASMP